MAQSVSTIQNNIIADLVTAAAAVGVTIDPAEFSDYDYRQLLTYVAAVAAGTEQQLWDAYKIDTEAAISKARPQTGGWFQAQMYKFQYDATTPQILQFDTTTFAPYYPTVNTTLQIIKYASVVGGVFGTTNIKAAKQVGGFPAALSSTELSAAQSYVNLIAIGGINYNVTSLNSDKIYVEATIWYQGLYSAIIQSTVIAAINAYLAGIPFDGVVILSDLERAIKAVAGVNDIVFSNVQARQDTTAYGSGTNLVLSNAVVQRNWSTIAGYAVTETDTGHTISDTLTFIAQ